MSKCWKCGTDNVEGMSFCTNCGNPLGNRETTPAGAAPENFSQSETISFNQPPQTSPTGWPTAGYAAPSQPQPAAQGKKNTALIISILAAVLVVGGVVVVGLFGWFYYAKSGPADNENRKIDEKGLNGDANKGEKSDPKASPTPSGKLFEPPTTATKDGTFTVYANKGWQMSNIAVVPLEEYTTSVEGIVDLAGAKAGLRPGGTNDAKLKGRRLFQEWPAGALLMRTRYADGSFSNTVAVSAGGATGSWKNLPDERGMLEFTVNDNAPQDNGGQFTIRVKMTKVPKGK
jgi:hypothetical protein